MRFILIKILLVTIPFFNAFSNNPDYIIGNSNPYDGPGLHYMAVSLGAAGWYSSMQVGMLNQKLPYSIKIDYGRSESPFGINLGLNMLSTYIYEDFLLNPNHLSLSITYRPFKVINKSNFRLYTFGGANLSYSRFTEQKYSGVVNYENKVEKNFALGWQAGLNITYKYRNMEIGPSFVYYISKANFLAGYFNKQTYNTGSLQLNVLLKYNIVFDKNKNVCPAYKKFQRYKL